MNPELPGDALEFGETARKAFEKLGGVDAARRAEEDHAFRAEVGATLSALGVDDIDPRADLDTLAAAATLCFEAGRVVLPYPMVGALLRDEKGVPFAVVPNGRNGRARIDHGDLFDEWRVATLDGEASSANRVAPIPAGGFSSTQFGRLGPFVADLTTVRTDVRDLGALDNSGHDAQTAMTQIAITLGSWQILGATDRAVELAADHVSNRIQFGKPIATFQAVQFMLADAAVAVAGLRELAHFTLWRLVNAPIESRADVLALRVHALDTARAVLRTCQQLHGASGVCDEYDISVITRHIQPALRLPFGAERTAALLADAINDVGFVGLFPHGGAHP